MTYAADTLYDEVAYVAFHLGWSREAILDLEHPERARYVTLVARMADPGRQGG